MEIITTKDLSDAERLGRAIESKICSMTVFRQYTDTDSFLTANSVIELTASTMWNLLVTIIQSGENDEKIIKLISTFTEQLEDSMNIFFHMVKELEDQAIENRKDTKKWND